MTPQDFEKLLSSRLEAIQNTLGSKAKEYASDGDRLHNFKVAAGIDGSTQAEALWGMSKKHLVCIIDMVQGRLEPTPEMVDEKIGDMINYLILLEAVFKEDSTPDRKITTMCETQRLECTMCGCNEVLSSPTSLDYTCKECGYTSSFVNFIIEDGERNE